jgi:hypothetical protein
VNPTAEELADADRPTARAAGRAIATGTTRQPAAQRPMGVTYDIGALVTADRGDLHAIAAA